MQNKLPIELYRPIVRHIAVSSPSFHPLYNLLFTSRTLQEEAERCLYHRVRCTSNVGPAPGRPLTDRDKSHYLIFERIAGSPRLASYIHHLDLRGFSQSNGAYRANDIRLWRSFSNAYKWMENLKILWLPNTELLRRPISPDFNFTLIPDTSALPFQLESFGYLSPSYSELNPHIREPFTDFFQAQVAGLRELRVEGEEMVVPLLGVVPNLESAIVEWNLGRDLVSQGTLTHLTILFRSWWNDDSTSFEGAETLRSLWFNRIDMLPLLPLLSKSFPFLRFLHIVVV